MSDEDKHISRTFLVQQAAPPVLRVTYGETAADYRLTAPRITLGRASDNTIVIPLRTVSRLHAVLTATPGGYTISDQNSTNGLLYRGQRIAQHHLLDGDVLRISDELGNVATLSYHDSARPAARQVSTVAFASGQHTLTIGRAADNDLALPHPQVSADHAVIRRDSHDTLLEDLGSTNGTYLNGQRIGTARLQPGDVIQIGVYTLVYQDDAIAQAASADEVRLDAIDLSKALVSGAGRAQPLLQHISLSVYPRELVALVGGSGTGKSTLLGALHGFAPASAGCVLINGSPHNQQAAYRSSPGYVPQDDILHPALTVERTLYYAARLRLPPDISRDELSRRIDEVLADIDMTPYRSSKVAHLSGGQRKRVSIAVELLARPSLFFLDEPTSGLDPGLDKRIISLLRTLADRGCTVIIVTHTTANLMLCDMVGVLAYGGRLCFYGPPRDALAFFETHEFSDIYARLEQSAAMSAEWHTRFQQSVYYDEYIRGRLAQVSRAPDADAPRPATSQHAPYRRVLPLLATAWRQFVLLSRRYGEVLRHDRFALLLLLLPAPLSGLLIALIAPGNVFADGQSPTDAQYVLFLLAIAAVLLGANNAAREIAREAPLYRRERLANLQVTPYILSKAAVLLLLCLLQSVLLVGVVLPFVGAPPAGVFLPGTLELVASAWLAALGGAAMGLLVSALASNADKALGFVPLLLLPQIMLAGLIFPLHGPTEVLSYAIVAKWATDGMGTTADLNRLYYQATASAPPGIGSVEQQAFDSSFDPARYADTAVLRRDYSAQAHALSRRRRLLQCWLRLLGLSACFLALTYAVQRRKDRAWQTR